MDNAVVIVDKEIDQSEADNLKSLLELKKEISLGANGTLNGKNLDLTMNQLGIKHWT